MILLAGALTAMPKPSGYAFKSKNSYIIGSQKNQKSNQDIVYYHHRAI